MWSQFWKVLQNLFLMKRHFMDVSSILFISFVGRHPFYFLLSHLSALINITLFRVCSDLATRRAFHLKPYFHLFLHMLNYFEFLFENFFESIFSLFRKIDTHLDYLQYMFSENFKFCCRLRCTQKTTVFWLKIRQVFKWMPKVYQKQFSVFI